MSDNTCLSCINRRCLVGNACGAHFTAVSSGSGRHSLTEVLSCVPTMAVA